VCEGADIYSTLYSLAGRVFSTRGSHIVLLAVAYVVFSRVGQVFAIPPGNVTAVWIPSGIVLSAILLKGNYLWPGIFIGAFIVNIWGYCDFSTSDNILRSVIASACNGVGNSIAAIFGAHFIKRMTGSIYPFIKGSDVFVFILYGAVMGGGISAVIGVTSLSLVGFVEWSGYLTVWVTWWVGNVVGVLLFVPVLLSVHHWKEWGWLTINSGCELLLFFVSLLVLSLLVVEGNIVSPSITLPVILLLPLLIWSVFRFPNHVTFLSMVIMSALILIEKAQFFGMSAPGLVDVSILEIQLFMFVVSVTSLVLLANKENKDQIEASLLAANRYNRTLFDELSIGLALCCILRTKMITLCGPK